MYSETERLRDQDRLKLLNHRLNTEDLNWTDELGYICKEVERIEARLGIDRLKPDPNVRIKYREWDAESYLLDSIKP